MEFAMYELAFGFSIRAALLITILVILAACAWRFLKNFGRMRLEQAFNAADLRTWPLSVVIAVAATYGIIFAAVQTACGNSLMSTAIAATVATLVGLRGVPALFQSLRKQRAP
jgi:hypothetical protein